MPAEPAPQPAVAAAAAAAAALDSALRGVRNVLQARSCEAQQRALAECLQRAGGGGGEACADYVSALNFCEVTAHPFAHQCSFTGGGTPGGWM